MNVLQEKSKNTSVVLSIAGLDPSGGAGLYADIKTLATLDVWGMGVPTTLTSQTSKSFNGTLAVEKDFFEKQLEKIFSSTKISGVKIGLITQSYQAEIVYFFLKKYAPGIVVLDPVAFSSTGAEFWNNDVKDAVTSLLIPSADVITPNVKEAQIILNLNDAGKKELALELNKKYRCKVVVTGGDSANGTNITDVFYDGLRMEERKAEFIDLAPSFKHGTGCTFSSALCAYLVRGIEFMEACSLACLFVENSIRHHLTFDGDGGLNHNFRGYL